MISASSFICELRLAVAACELKVSEILGHQQATEATKHTDIDVASVDNLSYDISTDGDDGLAYFSYDCALASLQAIQRTSIDVIATLHLDVFAERPPLVAFDRCCPPFFTEDLSPCFASKLSSPPTLDSVRGNCARIRQAFVLFMGALVACHASAEVKILEAPRSQLRPSTYTLVITPSATRCFGCNRGLSRGSRCFKLDCATEYYICFPCNAARSVTGPQGWT